MALEREPHEIIHDLASAWDGRSDADVLTALRELPPLRDEDDACWDDGAYWMNAAYPYLALAKVAAARRLRPAIELLLERACHGDPGEIMRDLRHSLEAIANPDWESLAEICLVAARSARRGTRLWALDELIVLGDPRAKPLFEQALHDESLDIRSVAEIALDRRGPISTE